MSETPDDRPIKPMQPLDRDALREEPRPQREPIQSIVEQARRLAEAQQEPVPEITPRTGRREVDPLFAYLLVISLGIGLSPVTPMVRYVLLWTLMGGLGALGFLLGRREEQPEAHIDDLIWGITFGFLSSFPFFLVFGSSLETISRRMFDEAGTPALVMDSWVFLATAFMVPITETLFFRSNLQEVRSLGLTVLMATLWSSIIFFPHMELAGRAPIGVIMLVVFGLLNFMYSYVRMRNGLAAAWLCQTVSYTLLWFLPRLV